ncbi:hypothetical protein SynMVIR181_02549 [Synechococcus sp. MVIR-18-1]|nr:hypothetical protein SynMVIR181_02549 [Synechococcus sp. MVIR-18-1]
MLPYDLGFTVEFQGLMHPFYWLGFVVISSGDQLDHADTFQLR